MKVEMVKEGLFLVEGGGTHETFELLSLRVRRGSRGRWQERVGGIAGVEAWHEWADRQEGRIGEGGKIEACRWTEGGMRLERILAILSTVEKIKESRTVSGHVRLLLLPCCWPLTLLLQLRTAVGRLRLANLRTSLWLRRGMTHNFGCKQECNQNIFQQNHFAYHY